MITHCNPRVSDELEEELEEGKAAKGVDVGAW